jgi:hypothetical protein
MIKKDCVEHEPIVLVRHRRGVNWILKCMGTVGRRVLAVEWDEFCVWY